MEARLVAAQRGLIGLLVVSVIVLLVGLPRPGDARVAHGFDELSQFARSVDLSTTERARREQAMRFAQVSLPELLTVAAAEDASGSSRGTTRIDKRGRSTAAQAIKWRVAENAPAVLPMASLKLVTLADVALQSQGAAQADVGMAPGEGVRTALAFRLARLGITGPATVTRAELEAAQVTARDVQLVLEAETARLEVSDVRGQLERSERKVEIAQKRVDARKKRRSRSTQKFLEQLTTAKTQRDEKLAAFDAVQARYEALAEQAVRASEDAPALSLKGEIPEFARLRIALKDAEGKAHELALAVALERRKVSLPPLVIPGTSTSFAALRATDMWEELEPLAPHAALERIGGRISWQSRSVSVRGLELEGSWLLQVCPLFVVLALLWAARRAVGAATSYRLFSTKFRGSLRRVGFDKRAYELAVVVLLPLSACLLSAVSLWLLRRLPVLPAVAFTLSVPVALRLYAKLDELRVLNRSITQYHSYPPPVGPLAVEHGLEPGAF